MKKGDIVIIKSRSQLDSEGVKYNQGFVTDHWAGSICRIIDSGFTGWRLEFIDEMINNEDSRICPLYTYDWPEAELEIYLPFSEAINLDEIFEE